MKQEVDLLSEFTHKAAQKGRLFEATIELTHRCNLRCVHCYIDPSRCPAERSTQDWLNVIDRLVDEGVGLITFTGGEPLMHPGILDLVRHSFRKGCQVRLFSNANALTTRAIIEEYKAAGLCYLETSIYGSNAATHDHVTRVPGSFDLTVNAMRMAGEAGIALTIKTTWLSINWPQYDAILQLAADLQAYFRGSPSIMARLGSSNSDNQKLRLPFETMVELYRRDMQFFRPPDDCADDSPSDDRRRPCGVGKASIAIEPDGVALPCNHLRIPLGNVFSEKIADIWKRSPVLSSLRTISRKDIRGCERCDVKRHCSICMGDGWVERGDHLSPSSETCMMARARHQAHTTHHER